MQLESQEQDHFEQLTSRAKTNAKSKRPRKRCGKSRPWKEDKIQEWLKTPKLLCSWIANIMQLLPSKEQLCSQPFATLAIWKILLGLIICTELLQGRENNFNIFVTSKYGHACKLSFHQHSIFMWHRIARHHQLYSSLHPREHRVLVQSKTQP